MTDAAMLFRRRRCIFLQEEDKLESIVSDDTFEQKFHQWLDDIISRLDHQFEVCEQQLSGLQQTVATESGNYWCSKTIIDHCNLHISDKQLSVIGADTDQNTSLPDVIDLVLCLQQLKTHTFVTPKQRRFIEQCEAELKNVVFETRELQFITNALRTKLRDDGNARGIFGNLTEFQNAIEDLSPDVDQCEQLLEASITNGEMGLAEDISRRQLEIYERILTLITDQYPIIMNYHSESRDSDRRRRWAIFRMADKDITVVIEGKYRQIEACEDDLMKIKNQIENYSNDDLYQQKRYKADRDLSDEFLQKNKEKQQSVWNRIFELYEELRGCRGELAALGNNRRKEIDRRLQMEEREAGRRSGHEAFIKAATEHAQKLQSMIDNALAAKDIAAALNEFVLDGCESIRSKYDKQQNALGEMLSLVQKHHFKRFSDYYIVASRYLYRKERRLEQIDEEIRRNEMNKEMHADCLDANAKRFAELNNNLLMKRREVSEEVLYIRHKMERAEKAVEPTLHSLRISGVEYIHPRDIVEKINLNRSSTILNYREFMNPSVSYHEKLRMEELVTLSQVRTVMGTESEVRKSKHHQRLPPIAVKNQSVLQKHVNAVLERQLSGYAHAKPFTAVTQSEKALSAVGGSVRSNAMNSNIAGQYATTDSGGGGGGSAATVINASLSSGKMEGTTMQALYSYNARAPDELSFQQGDLIVCVGRVQEEGWFKGVCNQRAGLFPINYVVPHEYDC